MEVPVLNIQGQETGRSVELKKDIFGIEPSDHAIWLDTKQYMANNRQGTHKTKERADITGSTKKIKRQKGTGTARSGDIKSPIFRGGGRTFGPRPRYYGFKVNRKVKRLARFSALTYKAKENNIILLEDFSFEEPKTRQLAEISKNLQISDKKSLIVLGKENKNLYLSSRNLPGAEVVMVSELSTYNIMRASKLILTESAIDVLHATFEN